PLVRLEGLRLRHGHLETVLEGPRLAELRVATRHGALVGALLRLASSFDGLGHGDGDRLGRRCRGLPCGSGDGDRRRGTVVTSRRVLRHGSSGAATGSEQDHCRQQGKPHWLPLHVLLPSRWPRAPRPWRALGIVPLPTDTTDGGDTCGGNVA